MDELRAWPGSQGTASPATHRVRVGLIPTLRLSVATQRAGSRLSDSHRRVIDARPKISGWLWQCGSRRRRCCSGRVGAARVLAAVRLPLGLAKRQPRDRGRRDRRYGCVATQDVIVFARNRRSCKRGGLPQSPRTTDGSDAAGMAAPRAKQSSARTHSRAADDRFRTNALTPFGPSTGYVMLVAGAARDARRACSPSIKPGPANTPVPCRSQERPCAHAGPVRSAHGAKAGITAWAYL
jgi:hypothetical protein